MSSIQACPPSHPQPAICEMRGKDRVRVNAVSPGVIAWPEGAEWRDEEKRRKIVAHTLLKRLGEPEDVARTVQFLLNDAPYITGQVISVDGGRSINI